MNRFHSWTIIQALATGVFAFGFLHLDRCARADDVITDWNHIACDVFLADTTYQNPGMASRSMAMVNLAMYDSVNGITPRHQQFYSHDVAPSNASREAAAIQSAYRVLTSIYPGEQSMLDARRATSMSLIPDGEAKTNGISYGDSVANSIVISRESDGFDDTVAYMPQGGPGHWEPDPLNPTQEAWGPQWGEIDTFGLSSPASAFPPAMPDLTSQEYADAFHEVKELGARNSSTRTAEQDEIAYFWAYDRLGMGTPMSLYNQILRNVANDQGNDLMDNARLFALASTSIADAGITAWDSKFKYDLWRPISGIRRADEDGNPATVADPDWEPLGAPGGTAPDGSAIDDFTPPFPTYVSGHASFGGALFQSLTNFFETDEIRFDVSSAELPGTVRSFDSFSEASAENGRSRVYLGIHWNFDDIVARQVGTEVANQIAADHFQPVPEPGASVLFALGVLGIMQLTRRRRAPSASTAQV